MITAVRPREPYGLAGSGGPGTCVDCCRDVLRPFDPDGERGTCERYRPPRTMAAAVVAGDFDRARHARLEAMEPVRALRRRAS